MGLSKIVVRTAVITGLVGVAAVAVAGPGRIRALLHQTQDEINTAIDSTIKDPVALRQQIRELEAQYPGKIAQVRADLAQVREQVAQLKREQAVSERVVDIAKADLDTLHGMIAKAESIQQGQATFTSVSYDGKNAVPQTAAPAAQVRLNFNNESLTLDQAYGKATHVEQVAAAYQQRAADTDRDVGFLAQQEQRLSELLEKLEGERTAFQAQAWQLDHQIDAIARNDRLIDVMERRQQTIDEASRYKAGSMDSLRGRISEIRLRQEAQLETLAKSADRNNYEDRAKVEIDAKTRATTVNQPKPSAKPPVIQINPGDALRPSELPAKPSEDKKDKGIVALKN